MSDQESINILNSLVPPKRSLFDPIESVKALDIEQTPASVNGGGGCTFAAAAVVKATNGDAASDADDMHEQHIPRGCPFFNGSNGARPPKTNSLNKKVLEWQTSSSVASEPILYHDYLQLDKVLTAQAPVSKRYGNLAHDEHLFIVIHQAYELWFKQIIFELDSITALLAKPLVDERCLLVVVQRIQRINLIWRLLNDQIAILETMAPTDFIDFRGYLSTASGFQSLQFRIFENKIGLAESIRIKFNQQKYDYVFTDDDSREQLKKSVEEPSLLKIIVAWLERTPGLATYESNDQGNEVEANYLLKEYEKSVNQYLRDTYVIPAEEELNEADRQSLLEEYRKNVESFATIFDREKHDKLVERGERKLSHKAMWGALMIWLNRDEPHNHALLAQRQVGNKNGTGGSSGYSYLRSTASDRYKIFNDIVNLTTWLIPREYMPKLNDEIRKRLNTFDHN